jgi:hypothetical protein
VVAESRLEELHQVGTRADGSCLPQHRVESQEGASPAACPGESLAAWAESQAVGRRQGEAEHPQVGSLEVGSRAAHRRAGTQEAGLLDSKPFFDVA